MIEKWGWKSAIPHIRARFAQCRVAGQTLRSERDSKLHGDTAKPQRRSSWSDALAITFCDPNWLCCGEALCESGALSGCGDLGCAEAVCGCHECRCFGRYFQMNPNRALILDIDFTLIHLEELPGAIEVPGRTRSAYLAPRTVEILGELQARFEIVLATARSWDGTRWVSQGLSERGVQISRLVMEDGALWGAPGDVRAWDETRDWPQLRAQIDDSRRAEWPDFEWQPDFKACLVARCADGEAAAQLMEIFARAAPLDELRLFRDGRKVYLLPRAADKWSALQKLLGARAQTAVGVGDGLNDLCWLRHIATPATLAGATPPIEALARERGLISSLSGHEGIADILRQIGEVTAR